MEPFTLSLSKRTLSLSLFLSTVALAVGPAPRPVGLLKRAPTLDGKLKEYAPSPAFAIKATGLSVEGKIGVRPDGLWLGMQVSAPSPGPGDAVGVSLAFVG